MTNASSELVNSSVEVVFPHCSSLKLLSGCILVLTVYIKMFVDKFNHIMLVVTIR